MMTAERNDVSIRDQIVPLQSGESFGDAVRKIGADSIECAVSTDGSIASLGTNLNDSSAKTLLRRKSETGEMSVSALLLATDFSGDAADSHAEWAARMVRIAAELNIPVVRIDPWTSHKEVAAETVVANVLRCTRNILDQTSNCPVDLGIENHGQLFNDPQILGQVLAKLPDDRLGLTLDTGNLYWWGHTLEEVYELLERYAPRAKHTHIKNINYPPELAHRRREVGFEYKKYCCPLAEGNLDLKKIVQILRKHGYRRPLCVEDESLFKVPEYQKLKILQQDVEALYACFAG